MQGRIAHLTEELGLTEAQQTQIEEIFQSFREEMGTPEPEAGGHGRGGFGGQKWEKRDALHEKIKTVLTDEQKAEFETLIKEHRR